MCNCLANKFNQAPKLPSQLHLLNPQRSLEFRSFVLWLQRWRPTNKDIYIYIFRFFVCVGAASVLGVQRIIPNPQAERSKRARLGYTLQSAGQYLTYFKNICICSENFVRSKVEQSPQIDIYRYYASK